MCSLVLEQPVCFYCKLPLALDEFGQCKECVATPPAVRLELRNQAHRCECGQWTLNTGKCSACAAWDFVSAADQALAGGLKMLPPVRS